MATENNLSTPHPVSLGKRMLFGGLAGLALISFFLIGNDYSEPEWGKFWMTRPLIIVPLAGAATGLLHYTSIAGVQKAVG